MIYPFSFQTGYMEKPQVTHVDLGKIIAVNEPYHEDRMGYGGHYIGFIVDVQLRDAPLRFEFHTKTEEWEAELKRLGEAVQDLIRAWTTLEMLEA